MTTNQNSSLMKELASKTSNQLFERYIQQIDPNDKTNFKKEFEDQLNSYYNETGLSVYPILYALKSEDLTEIFTKLHGVANFLGGSRFKFNAKALVTDIEAMLKEKENIIIPEKLISGKTQVVVDIADFISNLLLEKIYIPLKEHNLLSV